MLKTTNQRAETLLERAGDVHHLKIYCPNKDDYIMGLRHQPDELRSYLQEKEPVVQAQDIYDLDDKCWLTVNRYNALVLNSTNMLIADVDKGDCRLDHHAGVASLDELLDNLRNLHLLDEEYRHEKTIRFSEQAYHVYGTHSGFRVICSSVAVPWEGELAWIAERFMRFIRSDPDYVKLCREQQCYRARLTPKPWRVEDYPNCVCVRLSTEGKKRQIDPVIQAQLELHDELTLSDEDWAVCA